MVPLLLIGWNSFAWLGFQFADPGYKHWKEQLADCEEILAEFDKVYWIRIADPTFKSLLFVVLFSFNLHFRTVGCNYKYMHLKGWT